MSFKLIEIDNENKFIDYFGEEFSEDLLRTVLDNFGETLGSTCLYSFVRTLFEQSEGQTEEGLQQIPFFRVVLHLLYYVQYELAESVRDSLVHLSSLLFDFLL